MKMPVGKQPGLCPLLPLVQPNEHEQNTSPCQALSPLLTEVGSLHGCICPFFFNFEAGSPLSFLGICHHLYQQVEMIQTINDSEFLP